MVQMVLVLSASMITTYSGIGVSCSDRHSKTFRNGRRLGKGVSVVNRLRVENVCSVTPDKQERRKKYKRLHIHPEPKRTEFEKILIQECLEDGMSMEEIEKWLMEL